MKRCGNCHHAWHGVEPCGESVEVWLRGAELIEAVFKQSDQVQIEPKADRIRFAAECACNGGEPLEE